MFHNSKQQAASSVLAAALLAVLTGCAGSSDSQKSATSDGTFKSVEALRSAYVDAGGSCDQWDQNDRLDAATESGDCDNSTVLSIYIDGSDARDAADDLLEVTLQDEVLVGANWIVNTSDDLDELQAALGGEVVASTNTAIPKPDSDEDPTSPDLTTRQFIAMQRDLVPALDSASDDIVIQLGKASCTALDSLNFNAVVSQFVEGIEESSDGSVSLDEYDAGILVIGAIRTFCADHSDQIPESD